MIKDDSYELTDMVCGPYEAGEYYHPFWRFAFSAGGDIDTVRKFSKILTGEIPLIAKSKANNPFYIYVPAFKSINLSTLTSVGIRLCRVQPEIEVQRKTFSRAAEMTLPESEAIELARFYWDVIRSKYQYLGGSKFDFNSHRLGQGIIVWLSLSRSYDQPKKFRMKKAKLHT